MWQCIGQLRVICEYPKNRPIVDLRRWVSKGVYVCLFMRVYFVFIQACVFCVHSCVCIFVFIHACVYLCSFMRVYMCKDRQVNGGSRKVDYTRMWEEGV